MSLDETKTKPPPWAEPKHEGGGVANLGELSVSHVTSHKTLFHKCLLENFSNGLLQLQNKEL